MGFFLFQANMPIPEKAILGGIIVVSQMTVSILSFSSNDYFKSDTLVVIRA